MILIIQFDNMAINYVTSF